MRCSHTATAVSQEEGGENEIVCGNEREGSLWSQQMQQTPSRDLVEKRDGGCLWRDIMDTRVEGMSGRIFKLP